MKTGAYILAGMILLPLSVPGLQATELITESVITPDVTVMFGDDHRILNDLGCSLVFGLSSTVMSDDQYQYGMTYTAVRLDGDTQFDPLPGRSIPDRGVLFESGNVAARQDGFMNSRAAAHIPRAFPFIPRSYSFRAGPEMNYCAGSKISTYLNDTKIDQVHLTGSQCMVNGFIGLSYYLDSRVSLGLSATVTLVDLLRSRYGAEYYPYVIRASVTYVFAVAE